MTAIDEKDIVKALENLRSLARRDDGLRRELAASGVTATVVSLLRDASGATQRAAAGVLWTASIGDGAGKRAVAAAGAIPPLVALLDAYEDDVRHAGVRGISRARSAETRRMLAALCG